MDIQQYDSMNDNEESIDIRQYLALLWQWAWLILLTTVLAAGAAFIYSQQITPIYQASTSVMVNEAPSTKLADYTAVVNGQKLASTYAQMMVAQPVLDEVISKLGLQGKTAEDLNKNITIQPIRDTSLLEILVKSEDPVGAAQVANTLVDVFAVHIVNVQSERYQVSKDSLSSQIADIESQISDTMAKLTSETNDTQRSNLETKLSQYQQIYSNLLLTYEEVRLSEAQNISSIVLVEPAQVPKTPISPKVMNNTLLAGLVGMMLAIGIIFLIEMLDDSLKTPDEIQQKLGLPVLSVIAHHENIDGQPVTDHFPRSPVSESFRTLRTNVQYASVDHSMQTILVTSPEPSEGKTTVLTNLAVVFAQNGKQVIAIDADLRMPHLHKAIGVANRNGLSSVFVQPIENLNSVIQKTAFKNLSIINSGDLPPNPSELLGSQKMTAILNQLKEKFDLLLIDSPPTLAVTDPLVLIPNIDGVILVVRPGKTRTADAKQAVESLRRINANILGVVINDLDIKHSRYRYRYYKYKSSQYYNKYYATSNASPKLGKN